MTGRRSPARRCAMEKGRRFIVVSYDVSDDGARHKVAQTLEKFGKRVQYSVFECIVTERGLLELQSIIEPLINPSHDSIRYYTLCPRCRNEIRVFGVGEVTGSEDFHVV